MDKKVNLEIPAHQERSDNPLAGALRIYQLPLTGFPVLLDLRSIPNVFETEK
jgi:hypothetical protein